MGGKAHILKTGAGGPSKGGPRVGGVLQKRGGEEKFVGPKRERKMGPGGKNPKRAPGGDNKLPRGCCGATPGREIFMAARVGKTPAR